MRRVGLVDHAADAGREEVARPVGAGDQRVEIGIGPVVAQRKRVAAGVDHPGTAGLGRDEDAGVAVVELEHVEHATRPPRVGLLVDDDAGRVGEGPVDSRIVGHALASENA